METKDYHIGVFFSDDSEKHVSMLTCKRLGIRISSVYNALCAVKGIQTPYDQESYKQLWQAWTSVRRLSPVNAEVAEVRQKALNAIKDELEWLEYGAAPQYLHLSCCALINGDIAEDGEYTVYPKEERLERLERLEQQLLQDPDSIKVIRDIIEERIGRRTQWLIVNDEKYSAAVSNEFSFRHSKDPNVTLQEVRRDVTLRSMQIADKLTLRARYDDRPTYAVELDQGVVATANKQDSMSARVRAMVGNILDVPNLTDDAWRSRVSSLISALTPLVEVAREQAALRKQSKKHQVIIPSGMVQNLKQSLKAACTHNLRSHKSE